MLVKSRNFSTAGRQEQSWEKDGFGWNPNYVKKFEGMDINSTRYGKNFQRMKGICLKCDKFTDKNGTKGEHCGLPINEACQK